MTLYLDNDFKIHLQNDGNYTEIETDFFDGKCQEYIEGYRFIPEGETWKRSDGVIFTGQMVAPWRSYEILSTAQSAYEQGASEADETIAAMVEDIYNMDMEEIDNV